MDGRGLGFGTGALEAVARLPADVDKGTLFGLVDKVLTGKSRTRSENQRRLMGITFQKQKRKIWSYPGFAFVSL